MGVSMSTSILCVFYVTGTGTDLIAQTYVYCMCILCLCNQVCACACACACACVTAGVTKVISEARKVTYFQNTIQGAMSVFLSATGRFNKPQPESTGPSPGQYYKSAEWGTGYKRPDNGKSVFISQDSRFKNGLSAHRKDPVPGPGSYSQELMTVGGDVQKALRRRALSGDDAPAAYFGRCLCVCVSEKECVCECVLVLVSV